MKEFCPKCGKENGVFVKGFCINCFLEDNELVLLPEKIELDYCPRCNKIKSGHKWIELTDDKLRELISSKLKPKEASIEWIRIHFIDDLSETKKIAVLTIKGLIEGKEIEFDKKTLIELKKTICDSCMKSVSKYYEATIQVRFDLEPTNKQRQIILNELNDFLDEKLKTNSLAKITGFREEKKGFDVLIGSKAAGKETALFLAKKFNSKIISSDSLVGVKSNGKPKKRLTFCIRPKL
jgi:nonsense-mediated mRNA decay protein 3